MTTEISAPPQEPPPPQGPPPSQGPPPPSTRRRTLGERWAAIVASVRPCWLTDDVVTGVRWGLVLVWCFAFGWQVFVGDGIPWLRSDLLVWIAALLVAGSVGRRSVFTVLIDFLPFAAVLIVYDYLRGISETLGMPTWWHPQVDIDRIIGFGRSPTVFLQEHLKHPTAQWYDAVVAVCYFSFFFLPYVTAGVMWWRSRADFYRWSLRFVTLSFVGFTFFALIPSAPPWAAARCTADQVANHPNNPLCLSFGNADSGGLLGAFTSHLSGATPHVERISVRGFELLHLHFANEWITLGQTSADQVAAVPSLHLGGTFLFVLFLWNRVSRKWRPLLVAYPLLMTFSLVYSAEHYVADCLAGALCALAVHLAANRLERRRKRNRSPDNLDACPPSPAVTTPSST